MANDAVVGTLPAGSYGFLFGDRACMFVRIEGSRLKFFDDPVDPILATLFIDDRTVYADLGDEGVIEDGYLVFKEGRYKLRNAGNGLVMPKRKTAE